MLERLWVVPCKHPGPVVECVASIRAYHPDDPILVVDSAGDRDYMPAVEALGAEVADIGNRGYGMGAFAWALENRPARYMFATYDSLLVNSNLHWCEQHPVTVLRWFDPVWDSPRQLSWVEAQCRRMAVEFRPDFLGIMGPILYAPRGVWNELRDLGVFDVLPATKEELCGCERLVGLALMHLGYDVTANALQGHYSGGHDAYPTLHVRKVMCHRQ